MFQTLLPFYILFTNKHVVDGGQRWGRHVTPEFFRPLEPSGIAVS